MGIRSRPLSAALPIFAGDGLSHCGLLLPDPGTLHTRTTMIAVLLVPVDDRTAGPLLA